MSFAIDVNVLLYASNRQSDRHAPARAFLEEVAQAGEVFYLAWPTVIGYLRIATHPSVFAAPLTPREAMANVESLLALSHARTLGEGEEFWTSYKAATRGLALRGNLVPDAHLAAILLENGVRTLYTNDADFVRFPFLEVRDPFV